MRRPRPGVHVAAVDRIPEQWHRVAHFVHAEAEFSGKLNLSQRLLDTIDDD